jgi:hypothetical protein
MKKLILFALLTIGIASYSHSQEYLILSEEYPPITLLGEGGQYYYKIPEQRAKNIDFWARRGIEATQGESYKLRAVYLEKLMEQIREAKLYSDSVSVSLSVDLFKVRNEVSALSIENVKLQKGYALCQQDNDRLSKEVSRLNAKVFWKDVSKIATYVVGGLAALVLLSN